jgi:hypothetical protein
VGGNGSVDIRDGSPETFRVQRIQMMNQRFPAAYHTTEHILDRAANANTDVRPETGCIYHDIRVEISVGHQISSRVQKPAAYFPGTGSDKIHQYRSRSLRHFTHSRGDKNPFVVTAGPRDIVPESYLSAAIGQGIDDGFRNERVG